MYNYCPYQTSSFLAKCNKAFFFQTALIGSGAQPASYLMTKVSPLPGVRGTGREADHSPACSVDVKNEVSHISTPA